jgi:hypothetical protein
MLIRDFLMALLAASVLGAVSVGLEAEPNATGYLSRDCVSWIHRRSHRGFERDATAGATSMAKMLPIKQPQRRSELACFLRSS